MTDYRQRMLVTQHDREITHRQYELIFAGVGKLKNDCARDFETRFGTICFDHYNRDQDQ